MSYALTDVLPSYIDPPSRSRDADDIVYCTDFHAEAGEMCPVHDCGKPSDWRYICWECGHCVSGAQIVTIAVDATFDDDAEAWAITAAEKRMCGDCIARHEADRRIRKCKGCGVRYDVEVDEVCAGRCMVCDQKAVVS